MQAEPMPVQQSYLSFVYNALGMYAFLLPMAGVFCFLVALFVVIRGRGPLAAAALVLIVHVPLLLGIFAALQGSIASFTVIAASGSAPKAAEWAQGISIALVAPLVGMIVMAPGYATAAIGAFINSLQPHSDAVKLPK